ncbi:MAG: hypothetical protein ALAOOOJD_03981 [bacterium]|nr:hypothetical protein [bacterium]
MQVRIDVAIQKFIEQRWGERLTGIGAFPNANRRGRKAIGGRCQIIKISYHATVDAHGCVMEMSIGNAATETCGGHIIRQFGALVVQHKRARAARVGGDRRILLCTFQVGRETDARGDQHLAANFTARIGRGMDVDVKTTSQQFREKRLCQRLTCIVAFPRSFGGVAVKGNIPHDAAVCARRRIMKMCRGNVAA